MSRHQPKPASFESPVHVTRPMLPELDAYAEKLRSVWDARWLTNAGANHNTLEERLSHALEASHLSLFNNGTIALTSALKALDISGAVITTPFTFAATVHALAWIGITPVFADIDAATMTLDPRCIEPLITERTSAILGVHVYGIPCDVSGIQAIADRHQLRVIYDGAHAFGSRVGSRPICDFGDVTMLSFHATKLFHTAEGGALISRTSEMKRKIDLLKNFGIEDEATVVLPGINGKMNELQAALGLLTLDMVPRERMKRQRIISIYCSRLAELPGISCPVGADDPESSSFQYFPIRIDVEGAAKSRDLVHAQLKAFNVFTRRYFHPLCSACPCYANLPSAAPGQLPVAQRIAQEVLVLPLYGDLKDDDVHRICDIITYVLGSE